MTTHVKVLAWLFVVLGVFGLVAALGVSALFSVLAGAAASSGEHGSLLGGAVLGLAGTAVTVFLLVLAAPLLICAWGLLKFRPWARILGIILSAISLIHFPFGTLIGIYGLYVLFNKNTEQLFAAPTPSA